MIMFRAVRHNGVQTPIFVEPPLTTCPWPITVSGDMTTRWITFDCFGTLVDWNTGFASLLAPIFNARTEDGIREYHKFERQLEAKCPHRLYRDVLSVGVEMAAAELGISIFDNAPRALANSWGSMPVFPDVEPMLSDLRALGCRLAVLTNCDDDLFAQTQRAFRQPFDLVITAQQVQSYKPSPTHFLRFEQVTGVSRRDWVHVACSWFHDIAPTQKLGVHRIWLDRDKSGDDPKAASFRAETASEVSKAAAQLLA
jgi:2-haloacid dehalogenase